jgi:hypothetical protein
MLYLCPPGIPALSSSPSLSRNLTFWMGRHLQADVSSPISCRTCPPVLDILGPVFSCCSLQEHQVREDVESIDPEHGQNWPCHLLNVPQQVHLHVMWGRIVWVTPFAVTGTAFPMLGGNFPQPSVAQQKYTGLRGDQHPQFWPACCFKELAAWSPVVDKSNTLFTACKKLE